ncbi:hypothetical protein L3X38_039368 [Prunus dulcis]|uniref:Uncharacterized protein n=1 Tax=Prunus dulcis TaxID=3755 RepID=A0AAD4YSD7_PRUDU|nr:hypothetical protein L3X38_039368 [Prunus dulcis]
MKQETIKVASGNSSRPGMANDHDDEHMAKALSYIEHVLLDSDDELEEDGHAEENEQLALKIQEFEAFLLGTEAIAATQEEQEQPQPEQGSFLYGNYAVPLVPSLQEPAALHAQEAIAAQGMPILLQELGLGWFCGNYVPPHHFIPFQEPCSPHVLQAQEAIALCSYYGIHNSVPHRYILPFPSFQPSIQFQEPAATYALQAQEAIFAAQGMPQLPQQLELGSFHGIGMPRDFPPIPSVQRSIQFQEHAAPRAQHAIATQEQLKLELASLLRDLTKSDAMFSLEVKKCDAEEHVFPLLNGNEDPTQGIWVTTYDIADNEHSMLFMATKIRKYHKLYWRYFVRHHGLKFKDVVTLWAFGNAQTEKPCSVITSRRLPECRHCSRTGQS